MVLFESERNSCSIKHREELNDVDRLLIDDKFNVRKSFFLDENKNVQFIFFEFAFLSKKKMKILFLEFEPKICSSNIGLNFELARDQAKNSPCPVQISSLSSKSATKSIDVKRKDFSRKQKWENVH